MAVTNPDKTWADFLKERPQASYRALVGSLLQTVLSEGVKAGSDLGATLTSRTAKPPVDGNGAPPSTSSDPALLQAQATADSIGRVADLAAQSKLLQRAPASFQSTVQKMAAANGVDTLHISSTDFMDALKAQGPQAAMATLQRMPGVLAQLQKLPATGGDLAIPTGEMITGITGSGAEDQILPHLRLTPDKLSLAQLQQEANTGNQPPTSVAPPVGDAQSVANAGQSTAVAPEETSNKLNPAQLQQEADTGSQQPPSATPQADSAQSGSDESKSTATVPVSATTSQQPVVTAEATVAGVTYRDTNQTARSPDKADRTKPTLVADKALQRSAKLGKDTPNANMADAHAEIGIIQQAFEAGHTQDQDMAMSVKGRNVCTYCQSDISVAAERSGLRSLTIVATDQFNIVRRYYWQRGMRKLELKK